MFRFVELSPRVLENTPRISMLDQYLAAHRRTRLKASRRAVLTLVHQRP